MKILRVAAMIALMMMGRAYAQAPHINLLQDTPSKTQEEKEQDAIKDKAYQDSLRKIPDAKAPSDPWGTVRNTDTPKAPAAKTSSSVKPKTRTGSN